MRRKDHEHEAVPGKHANEVGKEHKHEAVLEALGRVLHQLQAVVGGGTAA